MPTSASEAVAKWVQNASVAGGELLAGAQKASRSQSASAIAAKDVALAAITAAFTRGAWEAGLRRSGDAGWLAGLEQKGVTNYGTGVTSVLAQQKYVSNSGKFDAARNSAGPRPVGPRGSAIMLARVTKVVQALRAAKTGVAAA